MRRRDSEPSAMRIARSVLLACVGGFALLPAAASADTIAVDITADELLPVGGTGCSLREAIETANGDASFGGCTESPGSTVGSDTITIPFGTYTLTGAAGEDLNATGDLDVRNTPPSVMSDEGGDLTLQGAGDGANPLADTIIVASVAPDRVIDVQNDGNTGVDLGVDDVRIQNGSVTGDGGGIQVLDTNGSVTVNRSTLSGNSATVDGGGIVLKGGVSGASHQVQVLDSELVGNTAGNEGGGLFVEVATPDPFGSNSVEVQGSTLYQNSTNPTTGGAGGGIYVEGANRLDLLNSTVDMNSARLGGGGIAFGSANPEFHSQFSTIADNTAPSDQTDGGAGLQTDADSDLIYLEGTIFSNNHLPDMTQSNCGEIDTAISNGVFSVTSLGYNLEGPTTNTCMLGGGSADTSSQAAGLLALAENGGETRTMALDTTSFARDFVPNSPTDRCRYTEVPGGSPTLVNLTQDQRGVGFPRPTVGAFCDIGAYEDASTAVADGATVTEDAPATAIDVLTNDPDPDGGVKRIASVADPANGTAVITGGGTGLTYQPDPNYCNNPPGTALDSFTYTLNAGSQATVSVTVSCVDDPPLPGITLPPATTTTPTDDFDLAAAIKKCKRKHPKGSKARKNCIKKAKKRDQSD